MLGPLYHLTEAADRAAALTEAARVLTRGGLVFAVGISRFASLLSGMVAGFIQDERFRDIVEEDLKSGQHRNPDAVPGWFTTAYFHHPDELAGEVAGAGFDVLEEVAVEGPLSLMEGRVADSEELFHFLRLVEHEPTLMGMSSHFMVIGRK
jgi:hypothetical protein